MHEQCQNAMVILIFKVYRKAGVEDRAEPIASRKWCWRQRLPWVVVALWHGIGSATTCLNQSPDWLIGASGWPRAGGIRVPGGRRGAPCNRQGCIFSLPLVSCSREGLACSNKPLSPRASPHCQVYEATPSHAPRQSCCVGWRGESWAEAACCVAGLNQPSTLTLLHPSPIHSVVVFPQSTVQIYLPLSSKRCSNVPSTVTWPCSLPCVPSIPPCNSIFGDLHRNIVLTCPLFSTVHQCSISLRHGAFKFPQ